ncbi:MAG: hypothetical protein DRN66_01450 [Candidatus Nanohalarchaeota archaeon]|nr:MAG: hypothetical protein DRN66_01450 [Candidatus Nanohaloarchaeota archaeon]
MVTEKKDEIRNELIKRQNDNIRRIRMLEEVIRNIDLRINSIEQRYLEETKKIYAKLKENDEKLKEFKIQHQTLEFQQDSFKKAAKKYATQNDLSQIKNYIELISPMLSKYVTKKEIQYYIEKSREDNIEE